VILRFTMNFRQNADSNTSMSAEAIVESEQEAYDSGRRFYEIAMEMNRGFSDADQQHDEPAA
jgi:hypothetical protein